MHIAKSRFLVGGLGLIGTLTGIAYAQELPAGEGKEVLETVCTQCHNLDKVVQSSMTEDRWAIVLDKMLAHGASLTDAQYERLLTYLGKNFGLDPVPTPPAKININKSSAAELVTFGFTSAEAAAIVAYREKNGSFKTLADLQKVAGVDGKKIETKKELIEF